MTQRQFEEPKDLSSCDKKALIIHPNQGETDDKALIIFVHGLGGHRYGDKSTWGQFPEFLFDDFPQLDIGLFEYRTLFKRFWGSVTMEDEAKVLADEIRDKARLKNYQTIILMGHSMGGLLCLASICYLIDTDQKAALARIGGMILMATPQLGSQRVPMFLSWLSEDFRALKLHGGYVDRINQTLVNRVIFDRSHPNPGNKVVIPTWGVVSGSDFWVDKVSATRYIDAAHTKTVHGAHTDIVKPENKNDDVYIYVKDIIKFCLGSTVIRKTDSFTIALMKAFRENADRVPGPVRVRLLAGPVLVGSMAAHTDEGIALFGWFEVEPGDARQKLATFEKEKKFAEIVEAVRCHNLEIKPTNFVQQEHPDNAGDLISKGQDLLWIPESEIREGPTVVKSTIYPCLDLERSPLVLTERIA